MSLPCHIFFLFLFLCDDIFSSRYKNLTGTEKKAKQKHGMKKSSSKTSRFYKNVIFIKKYGGGVWV